MAQNADRYWRRASGLMWTMLALWLVFGFAVHIPAAQLNQINVLGFPLGYYIAAQGSLIAFIVMLFVFAARQDTIDREEGVAEEE